MKTNESHHNPRSQPNPRKIQKTLVRRTISAVFSHFFLGLGWPWVAKFVGFICYFYVFRRVERYIKVAIQMARDHARLTSDGDTQLTYVQKNKKRQL